MKPSAILVGLAAGAASALLFAGLVLQSWTAVSLSLAAPIPIYLASLGWGSRAGFVAAAASAIVLALFTGSPYSGMILFASMTLPAAMVGYLAGLARPAPASATDEAGGINAAPPRLDWYPLGRVLVGIAVSAALGCLVVGWLAGYDAEDMAEVVSRTLTSHESGSMEAASEEQIREFSRLVVGMVPFLQPAVLVVVQACCLYISGWIVRRSGRLTRPRDDVPSSVKLPAWTLAALAFAVAASFAPAPVGLLFAVPAGAFLAAFTLAGLAALHRLTRGRAGRGLLLFSSYAAILFLTFPIAIFTVLGIVETVKAAKSASSS
ncbi:DUF2232 domain-containing protein [Consotaella salsifontis]|uniref:Predicted membrane protein n=1 Tax=Consotaella salsifontis TaxID=1365950 RepID=A0A1T4SKC8_9HYPH|nr:DUF2232 domain-containing protein [Consotaella salsifontis]SKA28652.1 Predicted membrane protein [Consotaella salsifontis]